MSSKGEGLRLVRGVSGVTARAEWVEAFNAIFWPEYRLLRAGHPNPKADALRAWCKVAAPSQAVLDEVIAELDACKRAWRETDPRYVPHAATWLNARIFEGVFCASEGGAPDDLRQD